MNPIGTTGRSPIPPTSGLLSPHAEREVRFPSAHRQTEHPFPARGEGGRRRTHGQGHGRSFPPMRTGRRAYLLSGQRPLVLSPQAEREAGIGADSSPHSGPFPARGEGGEWHALASYGAQLRGVHRAPVGEGRSGIEGADMPSPCLSHPRYVRRNVPRPIPSQPRFLASLHQRRVLSLRMQDGVKNGARRHGHRTFDMGKTGKCDLYRKACT